MPLPLAKVMRYVVREAGLKIRCSDVALCDLLVVLLSNFELDHDVWERRIRNGEPVPALRQIIPGIELAPLRRKVEYVLHAACVVAHRVARVSGARRDNLVDVTSCAGYQLQGDLRPQ